jgi:hypothetical protein
VGCKRQYNNNSNNNNNNNGFSDFVFHARIVCSLWFLSYDLVMAAMKMANKRRKMLRQPH